MQAQTQGIRLSGPLSEPTSPPDACPIEMGVADAEIARQAAEIERLREALTEVGKLSELAGSAKAIKKVVEDTL